MKIMIDITERLYDVCCNNSAGMIMPLDIIAMKKAIQNGTLLPEEKDDVKEDDKAESEVEDDN